MKKRNGKLELEHGFEISKHSDLDDSESNQHLLEKALQDAKNSETPVRFEIWKQWLPAEAAL